MKEIDREYTDTLKKWERLSSFWWWVHYILGSIVVIGSIISSSILFKNYQIAGISSLITAICAGLMGFLFPAKKALSYSKAKSLLSKPIAYYKHGDNYPLKYAIEAKEQGEKIISSQDLIGELPNTQ
ncbi:MAG: hypothetical protein KAR05_03885 [Candidatus Omnitrophica bacterium]|nr:hypothetical protein [Candidatus Omnitrophota bacterium]